MKTNLKINHDYLTLSVVYGPTPKDKVNLTINRNGTKLTALPSIGMETFRALGKELDRLESKSKRSFQEIMEDLKEKAEKATTLDDFLLAMTRIPSEK